MKIAPLIAFALITQSLNPLITPAIAGPGDGHGHDHGHGHSHVETKEIPIPESRADLWTAIQTEHSAMLQAVKSQADGAVHDAEGKLQVYLKALPEKVSDIEAPLRKRIEGQARNLARAYDAVHHAADDKAWAKASSEFKKAEGAMKLLNAQLPK